MTKKDTNKANQVNSDDQVSQEVPVENIEAQADQDIKTLDLEQKVRVLQDSMLRAQADFDNYRKRTEAQKLELINFAKADFMAKITPALDNFRRAFEHAPEENNFTTGIKQIEKQLENILADEGLTKIETAGVFNPNLHEAISYESNPTTPADHIIGEVETGWAFNGKVIKPAKVRVSKGK